MKFDIVEKKNEKSDGFYLSMTFEFGDGDGYSEETYYFSPTEVDELSKVVDLCKTMCGKGDFAPYEKDSYYEKIFNIFGCGEQYWKRDYVYGGCYATLNSYELTEVKHGVEYEIEITFDENDLSWYDEEADEYNYMKKLN